MGQIERPDALVHKGPKPGEARNPTGWNNPPKARRNKEIRELLMAGLNERVPSREHLTKLQVGIDALLEKFMNADRWAMTFVVNRVWGPLPLHLDIDVTQQPPDLSTLTEDQLAARVEALRALLRDPQPALPEPEITDVSD